MLSVISIWSLHNLLLTFAFALSVYEKESTFWCCSDFLLVYMYRPSVLMQATKLYVMQENRITENCSQLHTVILGQPTCRPTD